MHRLRIRDFGLEIRSKSELLFRKARVEPSLRRRIPRQLGSRGTTRMESRDLGLSDDIK